MYAFIGGAPTSGKTHLAAKFIEESKLDIKHVKLDDIRKSLVEDIRFKSWVNFFHDQDEKKYWEKTTPINHAENYISQSLALWPEILINIHKKINLFEHAIFEGVSILPELARKNLDFPGFFMSIDDPEKSYIRIKAHSRWGHSDDLMRKEAMAFVRGSNVFLTRSAKEYGYKVIEDFESGLQELYKFFNNE